MAKRAKITHSFKNNIEEIQSARKYFKTLSNTIRYRILRLLLDSSLPNLTVNEISDILAEKQSKISEHLIYMREIGILRAKQQGHYMYYSIKDERIEEYIKHTLSSFNKSYAP